MKLVFAPEIPDATELHQELARVAPIRGVTVSGESVEVELRDSATSMEREQVVTRVKQLRPELALSTVETKE